MGTLAKPIRRLDPKYIAWLHSQPCVVTGQAVRIEANHIRQEGHGGVGTKPDDRRALPMTREVHREYHDIGRLAFQFKYGLDLDELIIQHNRKYSAGRSERKLAIRSNSVNPSVITIRLRCSCGLDHTFPSSKITINPGGVSLSYYCHKQRKQQEARFRRTA